MSFATSSARLLLVGSAMAFAITGCGGAADEAADPVPTTVLQVGGDELSAVSFDVRRDPG